MSRARAGTRPGVLRVTDPSAVGIARRSTWTLTCQARSISPFDAYAAAISVLNPLCGALFQESGDSRHQRLHDIEVLHESLAEIDAAAPLQFHPPATPSEPA